MARPKKIIEEETITSTEEVLKIVQLRSLLAAKVGGLFDRDPGSINGNLDVLVEEINSLYEE